MAKQELPKQLIRKLKTFIKLPFHPQWHTRKSHKLRTLISSVPPRSRILDIGCYDKWPSSLISDTCSYIGLDYLQTATEWYHSKPDVFADAHDLPFSNETFDRIFILDVLEHVENPQKVLSEACRALEKQGRILIQVPFLYPIHDAPRDFHRNTIYGWTLAAENARLEIEEKIELGSTWETAALLKNLSLADAAIKQLKDKNPFCIVTLIVIPFYSLIQNLTSKLFTWLLPASAIMPHTYILLLKKISSDESD